MERPERDGSMVIRSALQQLISSQTALEICKLILVDLYGVEAYESQKPVRVLDGGNVWNIVGNHPPRKGDVVGETGPVRMSISKIDGAIVSFTQ